MEEQNKRLIKPEGFDIATVIETLQGSCKTIAQVLNDIYEIDEEVLTEEDLVDIGSEIFLCNDCGWWFDISEMEDESVCESCYEYREEQSEEGEEDNDE